MVFEFVLRELLKFQLAFNASCASSSTACHVKASSEVVTDEIAEIIDKEMFDDNIIDEVGELALYFHVRYKTTHIARYSVVLTSCSYDIITCQVECGFDCNQSGTFVN